MKSLKTKEFYDFAVFRLDAQKRRLIGRASGEVVPLTPKEFDVLFVLVTNAGRVIEKDELLDAVWTDTFVEEATLTRNVSWLRKKLAAHAGDGAAAAASFIETVPKRGYRFLPETSSGGEENGGAEFIIEERIVSEIQIEECIEIESPADFRRADFFESNRRASNADRRALPAAPAARKVPPVFWAAPVLLLLTVSALAAYFIYSRPPQPNLILATKIAPFSGLPGRENSPAFSPDGKQLVFSWDGAAEAGNFDVYVKLLDAGEPVRLTNGATDEINPTFAPDGKTIAFLRVFPDRNEIVLMSALGGAERVLDRRASYASLSFAPDGKELAAAELDPAQNAGIYRINLETGAKVRLTAPPAPAVDHTPRFAPDGESIAFIRYFSSFRREIFVKSLTDDAAPRQITADDARIYGLAWNADSRSLFFTSFRQTNRLNLWRIVVGEPGAVAAAQQEPQLIATGSKNLQDLAIAPDGRRIAFVEETVDENIWRIAPNDAAHSLIRSTRADHSPQFSPDAAQIVFASERTGNYEIWLSDASGKNQRQLTNSNGSAGSPRFSPDGKLIAFDLQTAGSSDVYIVSANGGAPRRLTGSAAAAANGGNNSLPAWSADGAWIFFLSNRSGDDQIWKVPASGDGEAVQITRHGAFESFAAPDGVNLIYSKGANKSGLWSVGVNGADEKPIPELAEAGAWRSWAVAGGGVYYTAFAAHIPLSVKFYDSATGKTRLLTRVDKTPLNYYANLAAAPDGAAILYARADQTGASVLLADLAE